jgi:hypothetical protein
VSENFYDKAFFSREALNSLNSARVVVPILTALLRPRSVIDVGCGMGGWLRAFLENGVAQLRGFDGDYVDRPSLLIDPDTFSPIDLQRPFKLPGGNDLALCLEVAEHIPAKYAPRLIAALTASASSVLFSAAIPGQKGQGHINERWPACWRRLFARHAFAMLDPIRPLIREDRRVMWWYRQNLLLFASPAALAGNQRLQTLAESPVAELEWIHKTVAPGHRASGSESDNEWVAAADFTARQRRSAGAAFASSIGRMFSFTAQS